MEAIFIRALQLILSLSILVIIHEFGHFIFARIFKIKVEKFYLFFDAGFALFRYKPKKSDTEYGIGWLPLGGYVKIAGMMDESMDKEQLAQPAKPWEFRSKPAWQRLLVMIGGVLFNIILAIFIYAMILFAWGESYVSSKDMTKGMVFSQEAKDAGFKDGDILVSADGEELRFYTDKTLFMNTLMTFIGAKDVVVLRNGVETKIAIPEDFGEKVIASKRMVYEANIPTVIDSVLAGGEAFKAGLLKGDSIASVNGMPVSSFMDFRKTIAENVNKDITISYYRDNSPQSTTAHIDSTGMVGVSFLQPITKVSQLKFSFFESFPAGVNLAVATLKGYIAQFRFVFTKEGISNLGGFGAIGSLFPPVWDWQSFWLMTAFLSVILAVMNILPIPMLDGGHVMFLLYEMITRRKPNEKFVEYAMTAGMVFLIALLIYANGNDIFKAIFK